MGEKIKDLSTFTINGKNVKIELNEGYDKNYSKYDIHIQSDRVQLCLTDRDYMRLASIVITANRKLESLKDK